VTCRVGGGSRLIHPQRVQGSVTAVRAVRITRAILKETRFVADEECVRNHTNCVDLGKLSMGGWDQELGKI